MSAAPSPSNAPPAALPPARSARRWLRLPRSRSRKFLFIAVYLSFCWGLVFLGGKLFWRVTAGVPLHDTAFVRDFYFPEIRRSRVHETHPRHADGHFDLLLLGGSVLEPVWGEIEAALKEKLQAELGDRVRLFNLAHYAHTSRDSLLKYADLESEEFELVIVYEGINDVRLNCCPRDAFRDDYSHFAWYKSMQKHLDAGTMSARAGVVEQTGVALETFAFNSSNDALLEEAKEIKTARTIRNNLDEITLAAMIRGDAVLLLTYAYYIPAEYTQERFKARTLDYSFRADGRSCDVETWGKPPYVAAAVDAQNDAVRALAAALPNVLFVDQRKLMPEEGRLFVDPCHLTEDGSRLFVDNLWPAVAQRIAEWKATQAGADGDRD